jgi:hypothetical protein
VTSRKKHTDRRAASRKKPGFVPLPIASRHTLRYHSGVSDSGGGKSTRLHPFTWMVMAVVLLPLLYLLSVSPLVYYTIERTGPYHTSGSGRPFWGTTVPPWVEQYLRPYRWVCFNTPLRTPLEAYGRLWDVNKKIGNHGNLVF